MIVLRNKNFSTTGKVLGYGTGYVAGGLVGGRIGEKIGSNFKRPLNEKDIKSQKDQLKSREDLIKYLSTHTISGRNIGKLTSDDDILPFLNQYGMNWDDPDEYDYNLLNKNKQKIISGIQGLINQNKAVLANPEKHPGNYSKAGGLIGSTIGVAGGLLAAHKLMK